jgi:aminoglycoside phosphotransferase family enzyme/predicted kinase
MTDKQVQLLLRPEAYEAAAGPVRMIQTHTSWVFLTGTHAYKVKKPVYFGFLDYRTLEARKVFCEDELRLNQRLSPDLYCGVITINERNGRIRVGGPGEVVDYCLKMKELPQAAIMTERLGNHEVTFPLIDEIARIVARFHEQAAADDEISKFGAFDIVKFNWDENFSQTEEFEGRTISRRLLHETRSAVERFLEERAGLLDERIRAHRVRECHGDLHSGNIFIADEAASGGDQGGSRVRIFDCIEFNRRFSCCDTASEIAFFVMDLEYHGEKELANYFVDRYLNLTGDWEMLRLLDFYKCYRAYVRGKVTSFRLNDPGIDRPAKQQATQVARKYFRLAGRYARTMFDRPALILMAGLPGVGKTWLGARIASHLNTYHLRSDILRKELVSVPVGEHRFEDTGQGIYASGISARTYQEMLDRGRKYLNRGSSVILDATFSLAGSRAECRRLAEESGARFLIVNCTCPVKVAIARINRRRDEFSFSDATPEVYYHIRKNFDAFRRDRHVVTVDTAGPVAESLRRVEAALLRL